MAGAGPRGHHFAPIDRAAMTGAFHCIRDSEGSLHSAAWADGCWRYSSNQPVEREITHYVRSHR